MLTDADKNPIDEGGNAGEFGAGLIGLIAEIIYKNDDISRETAFDMAVEIAEMVKADMSCANKFPRR